MSTNTTYRLDATTGSLVTVTTTTTTTIEHRMTPKRWATLAMLGRRSVNVAERSVSAQTHAALLWLVGANLAHLERNTYHVSAVGLAVLASREGRAAAERYGVR